MTDTRAPLTQTHLDGTVQVLRRRLLSGQTVPRFAARQPRTWDYLVSSLFPVRSTDRRLAAETASRSDHPSRKHDSTARVTRTQITVAAPQPGQPRRRDRRAAARQAAKA